MKRKVKRYGPNHLLGRRSKDGHGPVRIDYDPIRIDYAPVRIDTERLGEVSAPRGIVVKIRG